MRGDAFAGRCVLVDVRKASEAFFVGAVCKVANQLPFTIYRHRGRSLLERAMAVGSVACCSCSSSLKTFLFLSVRHTALLEGELFCVLAQIICKHQGDSGGGERVRVCAWTENSFEQWVFPCFDRWESIVVML